ncbi:SbcC/MukB-like Walker B domain-containing protein [Chryseobacterium balustinum]|uniref:Exonuclease SbcC n=1 Tax=Chryseobacterium balustinum TaxID=246 RepID=A0AAX2IQY9_9FLAO|nr:AAA family ATPase [Chryseobacterium balustinum]AZB30888.1 SMC family ATPase [Chryseobacterium balustinum]SKB42892.1 exonuclease SbcC [Chryseobacterium balustinum]SQA91887.1 Nuclease sbcCD subunit C [Chryseobacterium balustinum]
MIPIQLTLEGLYSYQERQKIDFENLTQAGLFGIFGSVGSGKSSILEAISFALYGETERLNSRDKRAYNMMNLKSNKSYIEFDFINFENKKFRATREFKRNSKNFEDVKTPTVTFYEWKNENWIPLEHSNAEKLIGLSYANFKRTIIIPQGQFKEFLELGATDRTNMMKEIFSLQRFDLQNNVSALNAKNKSELDQLEGQLKGFEEVNEEQISAQKEYLKLEQQKFDEIQKTFKKTEEKYLKLKGLKEDFEVFNHKKTEFEKLNQQKTEIDILEAKTELFDKIFRIFTPLISERNKLAKEISDQQEHKEDQLKIVQETEIRFEDIKIKLSAIQPQYEALNQSKIQENDLGLILQMQRFSGEIETLKERTKKGSEKVKEVEENQKLIQQKIVEFSKNAELLKPKKLDSSLLLHVGNWFSEKKKLVETNQIQFEKTNTKKAEITRISEELKPFNINPETFRNDFKIQTENLENQKKVLSDKRNQLEVQQKLSHFATELHDGESCPLCGALEHPNIVEFDDVNSELNEIQKKIEQIEIQKDQIQKQSLEIEKILDRKKIFEEQLKSEEESLKQIQINIEEHLKNFNWKEFNAENQNDFEEKRQQSFTIEKQIDELNQQIGLEQKNLEKERENLDNYNKALEKFKLDEAKKEEQIKTNEANLKLLQWVDYEKKPIAETEEIYNKLLQSNLETEENYQKLNKEKEEISPKLAEQKTIANQLEKRISELEKEISENKNLIKKALSEQEFNTLEEIQEILVLEINVQETRNKIQQFRITFEILKNSILEFETKLKDLSFDQEEFLTLENQLKSFENDLKIANDSVVKIVTEIERLEKEFKKKEDLLKDLAHLQKRGENLKIMTNLFKGAGFVQYISSIYLRQLCDHANVRFHRMTRNQLSLQLNENHDFEIIDYLNEGRSRSVKTLSGGQSFQVSLSLALALAESVQTHAQSEKNFFFIDEGFGTQDLESVNIVFETLMNLQKENRIVGIISHVEELKEKIPVSLNITKDEERGSLIEIA